MELGAARQTPLCGASEPGLVRTVPGSVFKAGIWRGAMLGEDGSSGRDFGELRPLRAPRPPASGGSRGGS